MQEKIINRNDMEGNNLMKLLETKKLLQVATESGVKPDLRQVWRQKME